MSVWVATAESNTFEYRKITESKGYNLNNLTKIDSTKTLAPFLKLVTWVNVFIQSCQFA